MAYRSADGVLDNADWSDSSNSRLFVAGTALAPGASCTLTRDFPISASLGIRVVGGRVLVSTISRAAAKYGPSARIAACLLAGVCTFNNDADDSSDGKVCPPGADSGDKDPSTPVGGSGDKTMDVKPGTNKPTTIDGRDYSGHALDQMQGRGVPPSAVKDAIENGASRPDKKYPESRTEHTSQDGRVRVITDNDSGKVITVWSR